jgi:hypothetical protein
MNGDNWTARPALMNIVGHLRKSVKMLGNGSGIVS